jgi:DUF4097 and DUF4098 domain-containing protein YvlB
MRKRFMKRLLQVFASLALACTMAAQDPAKERVSVPFSNPSGPKSLEAKLVHGSITVRGYEGNEVVVESTYHGPARDRRSTDRQYPGMRRLNVRGSELTVEEQNNTVEVKVEPPVKVDVVIQVPRATSVKLETINDGNIIVEGLQGEIDANNLNGNITLTNVSGAAVVHALNGNIEAVFQRVGPDKPMAFSSLNGNIDVTFPADVRARVKLKSDNGDVFTDFDVQMQGGRTSDRAVHGTINGGGPEMSFTTLNGKILIRKK